MASPQIAEIELPDGITASISDSVLSITGPKGSTSNSFITNKVSLSTEQGKVILKSRRDTRNEKRILGTFKAHLKNMIKGVTEGHYYKLKICSSHFPMSVSVNGNQFVVKNFFGEKTPRSFTLPDGVTVKIKGNDVEVESVDRGIAGRVAASIEQLTKRTGFDRRIFQDSIYIVSRDKND